MAFFPAQLFSFSAYRRLQERAHNKEISEQERLFIWTIERLEHQLPRITDRFRRENLCAVDAVSSLWKCTDLERGVEVLIRYPHPEWSNEACVVRHLKRSASVDDHLGVLVVPQWHAFENTGFLIYSLEHSVSFEDYAESFAFGESEWTVLLFRILSALNLYHHRSSSPLSPLVDLVYFFDEGPRLIWFQPFPVAFHPQQDLQQLGSWLELNMKQNFAEFTLPRLVSEWSEHSPPSAATALSLAQSCFYQS